MNELMGVFNCDEIRCNKVAISIVDEAVGFLPHNFNNKCVFIVSCPVWINH